VGAPEARRVAHGIERRVPLGEAVGIVDLLRKKAVQRRGEVVAEALAHRALVAARAVARDLIVLDRVAVLVVHDVGVLGVVDAALAVVDDLLGGVVIRVVGLLAVG